ncbi:uncharacterized protein LOC125231981 [Leguminivora glycinivorella]|uniref:uncharacterized protein LOC125231981 n=1 Tax=Leguminivora glycinivorella TaxID=1035111 RepID=UPI00200DD4C1|nr:uncharacterized protein LOC125231981 [Leguminivora glycinivorella]
MSTQKLTKWLPSALKKFRANRRPIDLVGHNVLGIEDLMQREKISKILIEPMAVDQHHQAVQILKEHYLREHVLIRAHGMNVMHDNALDEYLYNLLRQGNTICAKTYDGTPVGICVNTVSNSVDPKILKDYAHYRQDPATKEFLSFIAKLQETPNLWDVFKVPKIFEIKMLTVIPKYRRRGLATMLAESSNEMADTQGYDVVRMDCINPHDYKIAERLLFHCMAKIPLKVLHARNQIGHGDHYTPVGYVRVYVGARSRDHPDSELKKKRRELESLVE